MQHAGQAAPTLCRRQALPFSQLPPEDLQLLLRLGQGAGGGPAAAQQRGGCGRGEPRGQERGQPRGQCRQGGTNGFGQGVKVKAWRQEREGERC